MRRVNLFELDLQVDDEPDGYGAPFAKLRDPLHAERLAATWVELAQGQAVCPYHYELAEEEWLLVFAGTPTVRTPEGETTLAPGDVACFSRGPAGAHKIANAAAEPARVLIISERAGTAATVYPDSDKLGVFASDLRLVFRRSDAADYWDGE